MRPACLGEFLTQSAQAGTSPWSHLPSLHLSQISSASSGSVPSLSFHAKRVCIYTHRWLKIHVCIQNETEHREYGYLGFRSQLVLLINRLFPCACVSSVWLLLPPIWTSASFSVNRLCCIRFSVPRFKSALFFFHILNHRGKLVLNKLCHLAHKRLTTEQSKYSWWIQSSFT